MALTKYAKNAWGKRRPLGEPYCIIEMDGWTWKILKAYQSRKNEEGNKYARYFCAVQSPFTYGTYDMGDVFVHDIPTTPSLTLAWKQRKELEE